jgi:anti-sigma regulatory factor (Ser/Thr protein kinase)
MSAKGRNASSGGRNGSVSPRPASPSAAGPGRIRTTLEPSLTSVGAARRFVRDVLTSRHVTVGVVDVVELLTSEVVTNALLHASSAEELIIHLGAHRVRVEVSDSSPEPPVKRRIDVAAASGRGLTIVDRMASKWGVDHNRQGGKRVWFEVAR